jgi:uncharacterized protein YbjT (DUF2867 family)
MEILLTGINNYFGKQLKTFFLERNHQVICLVRNKALFSQSIEAHPNLKVIGADLIREKFPDKFPKSLDAAYYFTNYTSEQGGVYKEIELLSLQNYIKKLRRIQCSHLIYVASLRSGINPFVEELLIESYIPYTIIRTGNLIGKASSLIQIFEQMSNKLVIISNTRLAKSRCQPIALHDALVYLDFITDNPIAFDQSFDLCGPDTLSYREMLESYLKHKGINKTIITFPFVSLTFSTYWLSKNSGIPKAMARAFIENTKGDILCENEGIRELFIHQPMHYQQALAKALT